MTPVFRPRTSKACLAVSVAVAAAIAAPSVARAESECAAANTTPEQVACLERELRTHEVSMEQSFKALLAASTSAGVTPGAASIRTALQASQAHWRKHRRLECGAKALTVAGSASGLVGLECEIEFTKSRNVLLSRWQELRVPVLEPAYGWK